MFQRALRTVMRAGMQNCPGGGFGLFRRPTGQNKVFLTFDAGPDPIKTPKILSALVDQGSTATFFVTGSAACRHTSLLRELASEGMEVGNHTWNHWDAKRTSGYAWWRDYLACQVWLEQTLQQSVKWFRPPFGRIPTCPAFSRACSLRRLAFWSHDPKDFLMRDEAAWREWLAGYQPVDGDIILLHDTTAITARHLKLLLERIQGSGFSTGSLSCMA